MAPPEPITADEFAARRRAFADSVGDGVILVLGERAPAADYLPFQQNPAFLYLTGIDEPDAALIMVRSGGQLRELLFVQPRNPSREVWEGARLGPEGATSLTRMPAQSSERFEPVLDSLLGNATRLHALSAPADEVSLTSELSHAQELLSRVATQYPNVQVQPVGRVLDMLRAKKSAAELDRIRRATYLTAEAHRQAMQATQPGMNEFEIKALVEYFFLRNGGGGPAYGSIVGSGPNSTTLHYNADDRCMNDGEVLLFDVATYFGGYASDVTRTIPINGTFTPEQRQVYEIVLTAQKAAESRIAPGATWRDLNEAATAQLAEGLARIGLIDAPDATYDCGNATQARTCQQVRLFYMHGLGHGVGLEVHDPDISQLDSFQPGSAVTIEPGIYVRADAFEYLPDTPGNRAMVQRLRPTLERFANIGVRIEDVYIFDENGVERASRGVPRELEDVEALMKRDAPAASGRRADIVAWRCPRVRT
jgi:Xaa-Pro aminopeptidase